MASIGGGYEFTFMFHVVGFGARGKNKSDIFTKTLQK